MSRTGYLVMDQPSGNTAFSRLPSFLFICIAAATIILGLSEARGQSNPPATCAGPISCGNGVSISCPSPNPTSAEVLAACSAAGGSNSALGGAAPLTGAALRAQLNQQLRTGVANAAMQGAINGFLSSMAKNNTAAQQQQQAFQQEMLRRQQEAVEQQRLAEQQRIDAMFARLSSELKLEGIPLDLSLKGMNSTGPDGLQLKGMTSSGPGDLQLKVGNASATSYGLKGLPGIYVGGPAGGDASSSNQTSSGNAADATAGSGANGQGIPGLPGIYLDGAQPSQAPQLAQAAENLSGPERDVAEDTALHAAQGNPALTAPSQDPQVTNFQQANQQYQQALQTDANASQNYNAAQAQVAADQSAVQTAQSQLAGLQPTVDQQAALKNMMDVAKTDEDTSEAARAIFENANAHLSIARGNATGALASLSQSSASAPVDLTHASQPKPALLRTPAASMPILPKPAPAHAASALPATPAAIKPTVTPAQLCAQLTGAQDALRRLMETQNMHNEDREKWEETVNEASDDAWKRGFDMLREYSGEKLTEHINDLINDSDKDIEKLYREISSEKDPAKVGELQKEWEQMDLHKAYLQDALRRTKVDQQHLEELAGERDVIDWTRENKGDLEGTMEGVRQLADHLLSDEGVQHLLHVSPEGSLYIKYAASIMDSGYDIMSEVLGAQQIKQLDQNSDKFLQAERALQHRIQATVAQINTYKAKNPEGISCIAQPAESARVRPSSASK
jgi:hypothetical protein